MEKKAITEPSTKIVGVINNEKSLDFISNIYIQEKRESLFLKSKGNKKTLNYLIARFNLILLLLPLLLDIYMPSSYLFIFASYTKEANNIC